MRALRRAWCRWAPAHFLRRGRPSAKELGPLGEELVARALRRCGWNIRARGLRTPAGEVDLLAEEAGRLVCVEVKTARLRWARGAEGHSLDLRFRPGLRYDVERLGRQRRAALWIARAHGRADPTRLDLVEVLVDPRGRARLVHHRDLDPGS